MPVLVNKCLGKKKLFLESTYSSEFNSSGASIIGTCAGFVLAGLMVGLYNATFRGIVSTAYGVEIAVIGVRCRCIFFFVQ